MKFLMNLIVYQIFKTLRMISVSERKLFFIHKRWNPAMWALYQRKTRMFSVTYFKKGQQCKGINARKMMGNSTTRDRVTAHLQIKAIFFY